MGGLRSLGPQLLRPEGRLWMAELTELVESMIIVLVLVCAGYGIWSGIK